MKRPIGSGIFSIFSLIGALITHLINRGGPGEESVIKRQTDDILQITPKVKPKKNGHSFFQNPTYTVVPQVTIYKAKSVVELVWNSEMKETLHYKNINRVMIAQRIVSPEVKECGAGAFTYTPGYTSYSIYLNIRHTDNISVKTQKLFLNDGKILIAKFNKRKQAEGLAIKISQYGVFCPTPRKGGIRGKTWLTLDTHASVPLGKTFQFNCQNFNSAIKFSTRRKAELCQNVLNFKLA